MQVQFNQPVTMNNVTYGKGQHDVPDADTSNWFFDALVRDGVAIVLRGSEDVKAVKVTKKAEAE